MRQKGVPKEETRQKISDAVGRGFRKHGYAGIGVNGLAEEAGVTSGAFYTHFGSKEKAFEEALVTGLNEVIENIPRIQHEHGVDWVNEFAGYYLGKAHRKEVESGCVVASLTTEVVRFGDEMHQLYEGNMKSIIEIVANGLAGSSDEDRTARAWSMLATLIGGLNMVRAMKTVKTSEEVSKAIIATAIKVAGKTRAV